MAKKEKLLVLNATLPSSLKKYVEKTSKERNFSSTSDYIRNLIRSDQKKQEKGATEDLINALSTYLHGELQQEDEAVDSSKSVEILNQKLLTISSLFELGANLRSAKLQRQNPNLSQKDLLKKLNAWALSSSLSEEVPGFIEVSENRKRALLND